MAGNSPGVRLRPARRRDVFAIVMISNSSVDEGEDIGFGTPRSELVFSDARRLSAAWKDPNFVREEEVWLAELDGRVVGCVTVGDRGEALELINIDVPREFQGRGIGTRMVRLVEERARREGKRSVTLGTSRNAAGVAWKSLPWWESRGYRITGEEENDWTRILHDDTIVVKTIVFEGNVVGSVAKFVDKEFGKPEITYWIGKEYWGMGLATQALSKLLRDIRVRPIYGRAAKDNVASIRVMEKCGFTISGYGKGFANARAKEIEEVILELGGPSGH